MKTTHNGRHTQVNQPEEMSLVVLQLEPALRFSVCLKEQG